MANDLKPCPFCGGKAKTDTILGRPGVTCTKCRAFMRALFGEEENEVIEAWNRRVKDEEEDDGK